MALTSYDLTGEEYHHTVADVDALKRLARMLPEDPVIVNIGACFGTSTLAMAEERPDAFIFSIDVKECSLEPKHFKEAGLKPPVRILGRSQEVGRHWNFPVDLVFVDGAHGYQAVRDDIREWRRVASILALHDYGKAVCPQVKPAVDDEIGDLEPFLAVESLRAYRT